MKENTGEKVGLLCLKQKNALKLEDLNKNMELVEEFDRDKHIYKGVANINSDF